MIVLAASIAALAVIGACVARLTRGDGESRATTATRAVLAAAAALVVVHAALGAAAWLTPAATLIALGLLATAATLWVRRRPRPAPARREPWSAGDVALTAALVALLGERLWHGLLGTTLLYDTLSYHLHMPATWMHETRLSIVPAVFGDPSPAYAPANLELWFLFLMAPLRSDALASIGQLPLAGLAALAIVAAVRETGGGRRPALAAALAFLLVPEIAGQTPTAMTDVGLAAFLLASLPFVARHDIVGTSAALGLAVGTKYAGVVLALPFAVVAVAAIRRKPVPTRAALAALGVFIATGGFWYLRNLVVTGNPLYPVAVPALPLPARYGGPEMRAWDYHVPIGDVAALGESLLAAGIGFASAAAIALARAWRQVELPLALALVAAFWLVVPYQESRFLFAAFGVAAVAMGRAARQPPPLLGWAVLGAAIAPAVLALVLSLPHRGYDAGPRRHSLGDDELSAAWSWVEANVHDARVAYTGTNLAFPLAGRRLSNHVSYVNVAGGPDDRLHDFPPGPRAGPEPAPYRDGASVDRWLDNLRAARVGVVFVAAMYPIVQRTITADPDGFPVERAWADARPELFRLSYASPAARVYTLVSP